MQATVERRQEAEAVINAASVNVMRVNQFCLLS